MPDYETNEEIAIRLLRRLTEEEGWNEGEHRALAGALANFVDPGNRRSIAAIVLDGTAK